MAERSLSLDAPHKPVPASGRDALVVLMTQAGVAVAGILSQSLLAYVLLPEGRGAYAVCVAFATLAGMSLAFSADLGAQFFSMTKRVGLSKCLTFGLGVSLAGSAAAGVAALPFINAGLGFFQQAEASAFLASLLLMPLAGCSFAAELQLAGLRRFAALALHLSVRAIVTVLCTIVLVWRLGLGVEGAILALCAGHAALLAGCLRDLGKNIGLKWEWASRQECRQMLGYGLRSHPARLGELLAPRVGILALGVLGGQTDVGLFAAVSAIMLQLHLIADSAGIALYPHTAAGGAQVAELVGRSLRLACLATAAALVVLLAVSTPLVRLLLSEAFLPAVPMMWILAPSILALSATTLLTTYFKGLNRPGLCSWATWSGLAANIAFCLALHPPLGAASAAWGLTAGMAVRTLFLSVAFHRHTRLSLRAVWMPKRADFAYFSARKYAV